MRTQQAQLWKGTSFPLHILEDEDRSPISAIDADGQHIGI